MKEFRSYRSSEVQGAYYDTLGRGSRPRLVFVCERSFLFEIPREPPR